MTTGTLEIDLEAFSEAEIGELLRRPWPRQDTR